jgi:hypothetical protein
MLRINGTDYDHREPFDYFPVPVIKPDTDLKRCGLMLSDSWIVDDVKTFTFPLSIARNFKVFVPIDCRHCFVLFFNFILVVKIKGKLEVSRSLNNLAVEDRHEFDKKKLILIGQIRNLLF